MAFASISRTFKISRILQSSRNSLSFATEKDVKNVHLPITFKLLQSSYVTVVKKQNSKNPKIMLIKNDKVQTSRLLEAEKLAKEKGLKLVKIVDIDTKTEIPTYKLMTNLEYFQEHAKIKEMKKKEKELTVKETKLFILTTKITEFDLSVKINQMIKLINKKHEVKIQIRKDTNEQKAVEIAAHIQEELNKVAIKKSENNNKLSHELLYYPQLNPKNEDDTSTENNSSNAKTIETNEKTADTSIKE